MATITERALAATIDHAILKPELTRADVDAELDIAAEWRVFSVCVRPSDIAHAVARLDGTGVAVGTVKSRVSRARRALQATLEKGGYSRDGQAAGEAMRTILGEADRLAGARS